MKNTKAINQLKYRIFLLVVFCSLFSSAALYSQGSMFILGGVIEYQRKENAIHWKKDDPYYYGNTNEAKFITTYFDMKFVHEKSLYAPSEAGNQATEEENSYIRRNLNLYEMAQENTVYIDQKKDISISKKNILGSDLLFKETPRNIKWKITSEVRNIAGFMCRKATGIIMDSIYVIAFYTDDIVSSGGPESFTGLPGMILGLAIPRLHTTWYATSLSLEVNEHDITPPTKGKESEMNTILKKVKMEFTNSRYLQRSKPEHYIWQMLL